MGVTRWVLADDVAFMSCECKCLSSCHKSQFELSRFLTKFVL